MPEITICDVSKLKEVVHLPPKPSFHAKITFMAMKEYLHFDRKTITDFSEKSVTSSYANGYVFTRLGKGVMDQTRSVRIDLARFNLTSENRRILKKVEGLEIKPIPLPLSIGDDADDYNFKLGKLAKDFYATKFGEGVMSAQKIKELLTDQAASNFNLLLKYNLGDKTNLGYAISYSNDTLFHYSYPFYDLKMAPKDMGLAMMIMAIEYAKSSGAKYIYLGSLQRPGDTYKLQFEGLEWFDGKDWQTDLEAVKKLLKETLKS